MASGPPSIAETSPNRIRFSRCWVLIFISLLCAILGLGVFAYQRHHVRETAVAEVRKLCESKGGNLEQDLVDGHYIVDLAGTGISNSDLAEVMIAASNLPSESIDYSGEIRLVLSGTSIDDAGLRALNARVTSCDLSGLLIGDDDIELLVSHSPNLRQAYLANTQITDRSMAVLASCPLQELDIRHTAVTSEGLDALSGKTTLYILRVAGTQISEDAIQRFESQTPSCMINRDG